MIIQIPPLFKPTFDWSSYKLTKTQKILLAVLVPVYIFLAILLLIFMADRQWVQ